MYDVEKHAAWLKVAADKMHAELLRQCDALMPAEAGTDASAVHSMYTEASYQIRSGVVLSIT